MKTIITILAALLLTACGGGSGEDPGAGHHDRRAALETARVRRYTAAMAEAGMIPIEVVCVGFYLFRETIARGDATREEAIDYMLENTGIAESDVVSEIERYIVIPGQATSYKVGMMELLRLRDEAREALGDDPLLERMAHAPPAGRGYVLAPLTDDRDAVLMFVQTLDPDLVGQGGTSLAEGLRQGLDVLAGGEAVGRRDAHDLGRARRQVAHHRRAGPAQQHRLAVAADVQRPGLVVLLERPPAHRARGRPTHHPNRAPQRGSTLM